MTMTLNRSKSLTYPNCSLDISKTHSGERFDVNAYDFECAKEVLGPATTDLLFFKAQPPTQDQLQDIDRCRGAVIFQKPILASDLM